MTVVVEQNATYEATADLGVAGAVGVVACKVLDNQGAIVTASSPLNIVEISSGVYSATRTAPAAVGQFSVVFTSDGTYNVGTEAVEDLLVVEAGTDLPLVPLPDPGSAGGPQQGPCSAWTTPEAVADCGGITLDSSTQAPIEDAIVIASDILWPISGFQWRGQCQQTVRPCRQRAGCFSQILSRGHVVGWNGFGWRCEDGGVACGCSPLQRVVLPGYPVTEIVEVTIDGAVVDPTTYALEEWSDLVRVRVAAADQNEGWPACQNLDLPSTEVGTFSVTYLYGADPPPEGQKAADELALQIYYACTGNAACALPLGTRQVVRSGVTIDVGGFVSWSYDYDAHTWRTGLRMVDLFLNAVNPNGIRQPPMMASIDDPMFAARDWT